MQKIFKVITAANFLFFLCLFLSAAPKKGEQPPDSNGKIMTWEVGRGIISEYDTPIGKSYYWSESLFFDPRTKAIYKSLPFPAYEDFRKSYGQTNSSDYPVLSLRLYRNSKEAKNTRTKYVVVDFAVRLSPLKPDFKYQDGTPIPSAPCPTFGWSEDYGAVTSYQQVDGVIKIVPSIDITPDMEGYSPPVAVTDKKRVRLYKVEKWHEALPSVGDIDLYGVHHYRVIIDQESPVGPHTVLRNAEKYVFTIAVLAAFRGSNIVKTSEKVTFPEINTVFLAMPPGSTYEISEPTVYFMKNAAELSKLPVIDGQTAYPYNELLSADNAKKYRKNPELDYAEAMDNLYGTGGDWNRGVRLLERMVNKKHALAEFQTGLLKYRGLGTEKADADEARKYFSRAKENFVYYAAYLDSLASEREYEGGVFVPSFVPFKNPYAFAGRFQKLPADIQNSKLHAFDMVLSYYSRILFTKEGVDPAEYKKYEKFIAETLDKLCLEKYPPALRFKGLLLEKTEPAQAMKYYAEASALGNSESTLEMMRMGFISSDKARKLSLRENLQARDYPRYHVYNYINRTNDKDELTKPFITNNLSMIGKMKMPETPSGEFLAGCAMLEMYLDAADFEKAGLDLKGGAFKKNPAGTLTPFKDVNAYLQQSIKLIKKAADSGIPEAEYLYASMLCNPHFGRENRLGALALYAKSIKYLPSAIQGAFLAYSLKDYKKMNDFIAALPIDSADPEILYLKALAAKAGNADEKIYLPFFEKAANASSVPALRFLAAHYEKKKQPEKAALYRKKQIECDNIQRNAYSYYLDWPLDIPKIKPLLQAPMK